MHQLLHPRQWQVCSHIQTCRTAALGGLKLHCDHCDYDRPQYHACRDRHCPRCQQRASRRWCEQQQAAGQNLSQHAHLHCLIPGGALSPGGQWKPAKGNYLFPVRALSRVFCGKMVSALRAASRRGELNRITRPGDLDDKLETLMQTEGVVYSKECVSHTDKVVAYLARYSHRIAVSDRRIVGWEGDQVAFRYKDYRDNNKQKVMRLSGAEFIRRFLLHVLPKGFMRLRHYGFLANRCRIEKLKSIRAALAQGNESLAATVTMTLDAPFAGYPCPKCHRGFVRVLYMLAPVRREGG